MLDYTHQEQDIRKIWTEPRDPVERTRARIAADDEYLRVGLRNSARDRTAHLVRRVTRGIFVLWSADIPIRYSQINSLPTIVIRLIWLAQTAMLGLAALGLLALVRARRYADALLLAAPIAAGQTDRAAARRARRGRARRPLICPGTAGS
jgi:hypothetical protein